MEIHLSGVCTIETVHALQQQLAQAVHKKEPIFLSFSQVEQADLAFFQLIAATLHSCQQQKIALTLRADLPHHLSGKAIRCGLPHIVATHHP